MITVAGAKVQTITPSDKVNIAMAKFAYGMIGQDDLDWEITVAVANGELAPTVAPEFVAEWALKAYETRCDKRPGTCDTRPDTDPGCVWHS